MSACGVLLCAGESRRMGFDKLNTPICGKTAIERSMDALVAGGCDSLVFVVCGESERTVASLTVPVPFTVVPGGKLRTDSVRNGLRAASGEIAVIHDAARCFVDPAIVKASIESAEQFGSGVAAAKITDTVKSVSRAGAIEKTLDRDPLWAAQTPQVFRADLLRKALEGVDDKDPSITDESSAVERLGGTVRIVESKEPNPKITYPGDVGIVARLLGIA